MAAALVYIDLYQTRPDVLARLTGRPQPWRWRAINGNNGRILASGESYTNQADALNAIDELFGEATNVYLRRPDRDNELLRLSR